MGDLHERYYQLVGQFGEQQAKWHYYREVVAYLHPAVFRRRQKHYSTSYASTRYTQTLYLTMFLHNVLLAYRTFLRFKGTFFINLIGLSAGLACTLLIYLWVKDEVSMDKFHEKDEQLYQVMRTTTTSNETGTSGVTPGELAQAIAAEVPGVEYASSAGIYLPENKTLSIGSTDTKAKGIYAGSDFFKIFSFPLRQGDPANALKDPGGIVISEALATRLFNTTENLIGKAIQIQHQQQYTISGILGQIPANSSIQFDFVLSHEGLVKANPQFTGWDNNFTGTFLVLREGTDIKKVNNLIADLFKRKSGLTNRILFIRPFSEGYLYDKYENGQQAGGRIEYVRLFTLIAIFILLIACINFMNLSTAKAARRLKEVGIKKAIGAGRSSLVFQHLTESLLMAFGSLLVALLLVVALLPQFNLLTGKQLSLGPDPALIGGMLGITLLTGLLAGSYPALYLSGFKPIAVLKGKLNTSTGEVWARQGLVVFQFSLSVIFIVAVTVICKQIELVQNKNLGYNKDHIIYFEREGKAAQNLETFLGEAKSIPGVTAGSSVLRNFIGAAGALNQFEWEGKKPDEVINFEYRIVNYDFIEMMGIPLKEGRSFTREFKPDHSIIFNEAAIKAMGLEDPVGKTVKFQGNETRIVGVVKNFHFESLHEEVKPLFFYLMPDATGMVMLKLAAGKERETIGKLSAFYQKYNPGYTFQYKFLDDDYQALYADEQRVSVLSRYFAGLAILISCLGLLGLSAFTAERRRKEISIRKVLGASEAGIVYLLSGEFTKLVLVAVLLALPVSFLLVRRWLDGFAYRIDLSLWYFLLAGGLALLVAWFTVSFQALKSARIDPVRNLKDE